MVNVKQTANTIKDAAFTLRRYANILDVISQKMIADNNIEYAG